MFKFGLAWSRYPPRPPGFYIPVSQQTCPHFSKQSDGGWRIFVASNMTCQKKWQQQLLLYELVLRSRGEIRWFSVLVKAKNNSSWLTQSVLSLKILSDPKKYWNCVSLHIEIKHNFYPTEGAHACICTSLICALSPSVSREARKTVLFSTWGGTTEAGQWCERQNAPTALRRSETSHAAKTEDGERIGFQSQSRDWWEHWWNLHSWLNWQLYASWNWNGFWVSVWPVSAVKPRCKYWYNLHERLIRSLSRIQGFNSYFPRNKKGKGAQHQGGGKVRRMERRRQMQKSARSKPEP